MISWDSSRPGPESGRCIRSWIILCQMLKLPASSSAATARGKSSERNRTKNSSTGRRRAGCRRLRDLRGVIRRERAAMISWEFSLGWSFDAWGRASAGIDDGNARRDRGGDDRWRNAGSTRHYLASGPKKPTPGRRARLMGAWAELPTIAPHLSPLEREPLSVASSRLPSALVMRAVRWEDGGCRTTGRLAVAAPRVVAARYWQGQEPGRSGPVRGLGGGSAGASWFWFSWPGRGCGLLNGRCGGCWRGWL